MDTEQAAMAAPTREKTLVELTEDLEAARQIAKAMGDAAEKAQAAHKSAIEEERRAYAAFNAGVEAMRPKRPRKPATANKGNEP